MAEAHFPEGVPNTIQSNSTQASKDTCSRRWSAPPNLVQSCSSAINPPWAASSTAPPTLDQT
eukprot:1117277-Prymnesium_polylepis.1